MCSPIQTPVYPESQNSHCETQRDKNWAEVGVKVSQPVQRDGAKQTRSVHQNQAVVRLSRHPAQQKQSQQTSCDQHIPNKFSLCGFNFWSPTCLHRQFPTTTEHQFVSRCEHTTTHTLTKTVGTAPEPAAVIHI